MTASSHATRPENMGAGFIIFRGFEIKPKTIGDLCSRTLDALWCPSLEPTAVWPFAALKTS